MFSNFISFPKANFSKKSKTNKSVQRPKKMSIYIEQFIITNEYFLCTITANTCIHAILSKREIVSVLTTHG